MTANARCEKCGAPERPGHVPAPQDAVAASICWLRRESGPEAVMDRLVQRRRHPNKGCRYCSLTQAAKLEVVTRGWDHADEDPRWKAWPKLSASQQFAKVCEAQEVTWLDELPAEA